MRHLITLAAVAILAGCTVDVEGAACATPGSTEHCPAGQACGLDLTCSEAAAECDVCNPGDRACKDNMVKECTDATNPVCGSWSVVDDCAADLLACPDGAAPACVCPPHLESPVVLHADPNAATRQGLVRNGAAVSVCRYLSLDDVLTVATSGNTVKAVGFSGVPVTFTEPPLTIPAGVSVTTDDATPTPANYVVEPSAAVGTSTFISMKPGAKLAGFEVRNVSASGVGVETNCTEVGDTATVTIDAVQITGLGTGTTPPPRFKFGVRHSSPGHCSLSLTGATIGGASDTGVLISNVAPASTLTIASSVIQGNQGGGTDFTIGPGPARKAGGIAFVGALPGTVDFRANRVLGNAGDQILVFSTGTLDVSRTACGPDANVIACYASGVGLSSKAGVVKAGFSTWSSPAPSAGTDYIQESGEITGLTQTCGFLPASSCP